MSENEEIVDVKHNTNSPSPALEEDMSATVFVRLTNNGESGPNESELRGILAKYPESSLKEVSLVENADPQDSGAEILAKFINIQDADAFEKLAASKKWNVRIEYDAISHPGNLYIRGLSSETTRDELYAYFEPFGKVLSCKVIEDEFGNSKGYGFINYELKSSADAAIAELNGKEVDGIQFYVNHHISKKERHERLQYKKINYTNLYVKNIPFETTEEQIHKLFDKFGQVESVFLPENENGELKGYGFINFKTHEAAVAAQSELDGHEIEPGYNLAISRAERRSSEVGGRFPRRGSHPMQQQPQPTFIGATATGTPTYILDPSKVNMVSAYAPALPIAGPQYQDSNLYVKNLPLDVGDDELHGLFEKFGPIVSAKVMTDEQENSKGFGFVCFQKPIDASRALVEMNGYQVDDQHGLSVSFAQRRENRVSYGVVHHYNQNHLQPLFNAMETYKKYQQGQQFYPGPPPPQQSQQQQPTQGGTPNGSWYAPPPMYPDYASSSSNDQSSSPSPSSPPIAPQAAYYQPMQYGMFSPAYIPQPIIGMAPAMYGIPPRYNKNTGGGRRRTKS